MVGIGDRWKNQVTAFVKMSSGFLVKIRGTLATLRWLFDKAAHHPTRQQLCLVEASSVNIWKLPL